MSKLKDLYIKHLNGCKFKGLNEHGLDLNIKQPSELVGNNPIMQQLAKRYSKYLK